jgi:hypothetical protein
MPARQSAAIMGGGDMSNADTAFELAQKRIAEAAETGAQFLDFDKDEFRALEQIPAEIASLTGLRILNLRRTQIADLAPLAGMTALQYLSLHNTQITDLAPLAGLSGLQSLWLDNTTVTNLAPLAGLKGLYDLTLRGSHVTDLRPLIGLSELGTRGRPGLSFANTPATRLDPHLAELGKIRALATRARETLAYLRSLPPLADAAQQLSDALPLAEEIIQNPETGLFSVRPKPIEKPDLYAVTLAQVADAVEDVLHNPQNGLNDASLDIRKLRRTLDRYANDPQRIEMDFTAAHASITRQVAVGELPPSDENLSLLGALEQGALGIRATDPAVAINRRILQEQKLRELTPKDIAAIQDIAPVIEAITEGVLHAQMREDIAVLTAPPNGPRLMMGVTRADSILGNDEVTRVFGRIARMVIKLREWRAKVGDISDKVRESPEFKAYDIIHKLSPLIMLGLGLMIWA